MVGNLQDVDGVKAFPLRDCLEVLYFGVSREQRHGIGFAVVVHVCIGNDAEAIGVAPFICEFARPDYL